jgi:hypothetical protein
MTRNRTKNGGIFDVVLRYHIHLAAAREAVDPRAGAG